MAIIFSLKELSKIIKESKADDTKKFELLKNLCEERLLDKWFYCYNLRFYIYPFRIYINSENKIIIETREVIISVNGDTNKDYLKYSHKKFEIGSPMKLLSTVAYWEPSQKEILNSFSLISEAIIDDYTLNIPF